VGGSAKVFHRAAVRPPALPALPWPGGFRACCALGAVLLLAPVYAAETEIKTAASGLADLTLEQLANIEITSVSRRAERLSDAAASIYVITNDDIRRAGVRTLGDALRLAPNLQVARTSASGYAISARGFNNSNGLANKLLVLIDGRTVYSPVMSGVFWDQQDVMLEDVERIEVISGPGATLWGANAVNGVINVITRSAQDTQGALLAAGVGNRDNGASFRYGGKLWEDGSYRIYGKRFDLQNTENVAGASLPDGWQRGQVGFRTDWGKARHNLTIQGDTYHGKTENRPIGGPVEVSGMNLLARWSQQFSSGQDLRVQTYYDNSERQDRLGFQGDTDVFDIEFQHGIPVGAHKIMWGAGYRNSSDTVPDTLVTNPLIALVNRFIPPSRTLTSQNLFVQGEFNLTDRLELTAGIKAESNDYTGTEYLPSVRAAWKLADNHLLWSAASRAVRAPARLDRDFYLVAVGALAPVLLPTLPVVPPDGRGFILGGPYFESEIAKVYEIGYRAQPNSTLSYSITAFRHDYEKLRSGMPPPAFIENRIQGFTNGIEAWATLQATRNWRLSGGVTTLHKKLSVESGSPDPTGPIALGSDPDQQWMLRSSHDLSGGHELDFMLRRVGALPVQPANNVARPDVPAYTAFDLRWGWRANRALEVSLTLQNLADREHAEFDSTSLFGRIAFLKLVWQQ
jgi:iron complex outermembrane receptor protein